MQSCPGSRVVEPPRPRIQERRVYQPNLPQEQFIVPLLRREIEGCVERFASPARGLGKAVDIGCGGQPFRALLEGLGYSYCGVDISEDSGAPVDVVCATDGPLPEELLRRGPFDFLLCTEVVEHVVDWHAAFANFAALLATGGRALLTTPYFYPLHEEPYDFWRATAYAIDYHARRAGLAIVYRQTAGDAWDILGTLLGTCHFMPRSTAFLDRACAKIVGAAAGMVFAAILGERLRERVRAEGPLYLSNVFVLEKRELAEASNGPE